MRELSNNKLKKKVENLYSSIIELKKLEIGQNYCANLLDWFDEVIHKNVNIYRSKQDPNKMDSEKYKKERQKVFWINFGKNIGSEFNDYHFAVVLFESKYTALVVPLTSKKDHDPKWIAENKDYIVDLGIIDGYPSETKECYACVFMLQSVSKKRLSRYGSKETGYYDIKLSDEQMNSICDKLHDIAYNNFK